MIAYTVRTHFGHRLEGIFYDKEEAYQYKLFSIRQFYQMTDATDDELLKKNNEHEFAMIEEILDAF